MSTAILVRADIPKSCHSNEGPEDCLFEHQKRPESVEPDWRFKEKPRFLPLKTRELVPQESTFGPKGPCQGNRVEFHVSNMWKGKKMWENRIGRNSKKVPWRDKINCSLPSLLNTARTCQNSVCWWCRGAKWLCNSTEDTSWWEIWICRNLNMHQHPTILHVVERFCKSETHLHIAEGHFHIDMERERDVSRTVQRFKVQAGDPSN